MELEQIHQKKFPNGQGEMACLPGRATRSMSIALTW
jgi:hypothetical protein